MPANQNLIGQFIDDLLKQAHLDRLPEGFKEEYKDRLLMEIQKRIGIMALNNLSDHSVKEFNGLLQKKDTDISDIMDFLKQNLPNLQDKITKVLNKFQAEFVKSSADTRTKL